MITFDLIPKSSFILLGPINLLICKCDVITQTFSRTEIFVPITLTDFGSSKITSITVMMKKILYFPPKTTFLINIILTFYIFYLKIYIYNYLLSNPSFAIIKLAR